MGHSCRTRLWDTLIGHSCGTCRKLLWDTLVGHSCRALLWDTLVGHSCGTLLWDTLIRDTLVRHSCGTGHCCGTLYLGHSRRTLLWVPLVGSSCRACWRLRQHVSRSPVARPHANALSTKAAQIPMALRHHERRVATRSAQTLEANMSHDTTNHPAHQ